MELCPVRQTNSPEYPKRPSRPRDRRSRARGICRLAASLLVSLSLGACVPHQQGRSSPSRSDEGIGAVDLISNDKEQGRVNRSIARCEVAIRMSGAAAPANVFTCGAPAGAGQVRSYPVHLAAGRTCPGQRAVARVAVPTRTRASFSFNGVPRNTRISLIAPDGTVAVVVTSANPCVELDVEAGTWTVSAEAIDTSASQGEFFQFTFTNA